MTTADPAALFARAGIRNRFTARAATVTGLTRVCDRFVRVRVSGPAFCDFASGGPSDHVKVFLPDPQTGRLIAPQAVGPDADGIVRPDGPVIARDLTPLVHLGPAGDGIDLDFLLHENPGPAAAWAARAAIGDRLVVAGPRGSRAATQHASRVLLVVDGAALPAAARWLSEVPASTRVDVIADVADGVAWVGEYLALTANRPAASIAPGGPELGAAVRAAGVDAQTYVFAAGEASRLVGVRAFLKHELALPPAQYAVSGYWRRGAAGFDHHAPLDPADPD